MAKKVKKTKITETLVTQLQEVKEDSVNIPEEKTTQEETVTSIEEESKTPEIKKDTQEEKQVSVDVEDPKKKKGVRGGIHKPINVPKKISRSIQREKTYSTKVSQPQDSETSGISFGLGNIL